MDKKSIDVSRADKELAKKYAEKYLLKIKKEILSAAPSSAPFNDDVKSFIEFIDSSLLKLKGKEDV